MQDFHFHLIYPIKKNEKKRLIAVISYDVLREKNRMGFRVPVPPVHHLCNRGQHQDEFLQIVGNSFWEGSVSENDAQH